MLLLHRGHVRSAAAFETVTDCLTSYRKTKRRLAILAVGVLLATTAQAQVGYTFTSGAFGDGFDWPASPTGLLPSDFFTTLDGIDFYNEIGNNLFFDDNYQVAGNAPGITGDAMWGNPLEVGGGYVDITVFGFSAYKVVFNVAWSVAGPPGTTSDTIFIYLEDSDGRATEAIIALGDTFPGFGGVEAYSGLIELDINDLVDEFESVDGGQFVDIFYISLDFTDIATLGGTSEFAIDFLGLNDFVFEPSNREVFPSVNGGAIDVTNSTLGNSVLRGIGTFSDGLEVTNGTLVNTNYSTRFVGGTLTDLGQVSGAPINAGQTLFAPDLVSIDRSLPSAAYEGDLLVINDNDPNDPDNPVSILVRLFEAPLLNAPSPVDVSGGELVRLVNAAAPANGFRASVKVTDETVSGPFDVAGFGFEVPVKQGTFEEATPTLDRFGLLSGPYSGSYSVSLQMTAFVGENEEFEVFLQEAEPVPNESWTLNAVLLDDLADLAVIDSNTPLGPGLVGTNTATTAVTLLDGTVNYTGTVSIGQGAGLAGTGTGIVGDAALVNFSAGIPAHVVQFTYRDIDLCEDITEANLELLRYNTGTEDWELAVLGNSDGGSGATFFVGSYADFKTTLGGAPLSTALSTYGVDSINNHVWAIVDHQADFGIGESGVTCGNPADCDGSGTVDLADFNDFNGCLAGPGVGLQSGCDCFDFNDDGDVTSTDYAIFQLLIAS